MPKSDINPFLTKILSQPTAPFREHLIRELLIEELKKNRLPYFVDKSLNLIVGVQSDREYRKLLLAKSKKPLALFIAHMDHPGFHLKKRLSANRFEFEWHGGGPVKGLVGAKLFVANLQGAQVPAKIDSIRLNKTRKWIVSGVLRVSDPLFVSDDQNISSYFGGYYFSTSAIHKGPRLYTNAADDLAGVYSFIRSYIESSKKTCAVQTIGLMTVGEEVGWVGALAHFEQYPEWTKTKRANFAVSLEASRARNRASIGDGPVVRLGDKASIFDAHYSQELMTLACKVTKKKFQWRVMDGGVCEGTVSMAWRIPTVGLCVPLGNYHNEKIEGGPNSSKISGGPAPECIDLDDLGGMFKICKAIMTGGLGVDKKDFFKAKRQRLLKSLKEYRSYLP